MSGSLSLLVVTRADSNPAGRPTTMLQASTLAGTSHPCPSRGPHSG
jgi:hypothetical protein